MTKLNNMPVLRFKEFVGEWEVKKLREIGKFFSGGTPLSSKQDYYKGDIPFIKSGEIGDNKTEQKISIKGLSNSSAKMVNKGDLLYALYGATSGEVAISKINGAINQAILCIRTSENEIFLLNFLKFNKEKIVAKYLQGGQGNLSAKIVKDLAASFPTKPEQQKIANFLTAIDKKIQQLRQKHALLTDYKKGIMQQIFKQEIRFRKDDGGEFEDWEVKRLKDICIINPKSKNLPKRFIYIDLESVSKGVLLKENEIEKENAPSRAQRLLFDNDILFQTVRPYQMNNLYFDKGNNYVASTGYAQIRTKRVNSKYLYHYLHTKTFVNRVLQRCTGTSYPAINSNDLGKIKIKVPQLEEQQKIANFLSSIDGKIGQVGEQILEMEGFKKGLLQGMFV